MDLTSEGAARLITRRKAGSSQRISRKLPKEKQANPLIQFPARKVTILSELSPDPAYIVVCALLAFHLSAGAGLSFPSRSELGASDVPLELASAKDLKMLQKEPLKRPRLVHFWATWCSPCREEFPLLLSLEQLFPRANFELVTVSLDQLEDESKVIAFLADQGASCRNLLFRGQNSHGVLKSFDRHWKELLPYTVLIDVTGEIVYRREGQLELEELKVAIRKLLDARNSPDAQL